MTTRTLAGLAFQAHSPSLYTCELDNGIVALEYRGRGMWCVRCLRLDLADEPHYFPSLKAIEDVLKQRCQA